MIPGALISLADTLRYPTNDLRLRLQFATDVLEGEALEEAMAFSEETEGVVTEGMEELYTQTFDLNPVATLEVGWHLWGEQYERGRFLAELRELQASLGVDDRSELPDHLTLLLETIARLPADRAAALKGQVLAALDKIGGPLQEHGNPYRHLIAAAAAALGGKLSAKSASPAPPQHNDTTGGGAA